MGRQVQRRERHGYIEGQWRLDNLVSSILGEFSFYFTQRNLRLKKLSQNHEERERQACKEAPRKRNRNYFPLREP